MIRVLNENVKKKVFLNDFPASNLFVAQPNHSSVVMRFHFDKVDIFIWFESDIKRTFDRVSASKKRSSTISFDDAMILSTFFEVLRKTVKFENIPRRRREKSRIG
jgi:hypothetical protein